jgi:hypothetical protein
MPSWQRHNLPYVTPEIVSPSFCRVVDACLRFFCARISFDGLMPLTKEQHQTSKRWFIASEVHFLLEHDRSHSSKRWRWWCSRRRNVAYQCCAIHVISEFTSFLPLFLLVHSTEKRGKSSIPRVRFETTITVPQQSKRAFACVHSATVVSASVPPRPSWKARCGSCTMTWQDKVPGAVPYKVSFQSRANYVICYSTRTANERAASEQ